MFSRFFSVFLVGRSLKALPKKSYLSGQILCWDFDQCPKQNSKGSLSTDLVRPLRHWNVTAHPTCCGWKKGGFCCRLGMQRETLAEGLVARQGLLERERKRLFLIAENATSSCLGRSTENKYPTFLKCERPHLCNVHFLPVCLYSGAWSVSDPGHRANIATGAVLSQTDLEGTSGTWHVLRKHLVAPHLPNFPNNIPLFLKTYPAPERISTSYSEDFGLRK